MNQIILHSRGHYAKIASNHSIGFIKVHRKSNNNYYLGSGNLIKIGTELFFSTCAHVIIVDNEVCEVNFIELLNYTKLTVEDSIYIYSVPNKKDENYDYALIKIKEEKELLSRAANISEREVQLGDTIRGISYLKSGPIYIEGNVVELLQKSKNILQTNTGGTHGFSGSGYFNDNGELAVIHRARGNFLDIEEEEEDNQYSYTRFKNNNDDVLINSVKEAYEKCKKSTLLNSNYQNCFQSISKSMLLHARNPRTSVLRASLLIDLRKNLSGKTLIVKQGQKL